MCMHLTNYALNKNNDDFKQAQSVNDDTGHKRSITSLYKRLKQDGHDTDKLQVEIDEIIIKTMLSCQHELAHSYRTNQPADLEGRMAFELYGFDIILDRNLKPSLLEVNQAPSFATDSPLDYEIKRQLNAPYAVQFLKTYFNYYERYATERNVPRGKLFVENWFGKDYPYHTDDKVKAIPSKIANLKMKSQTDDSMFEPETYSRNMCDCKNQPIIVDQEDTKYWEQYSSNDANNKPLLFPPVKDNIPNNSKYYVCPTLAKPVMVLKANKGKNNKKYPFGPFTQGFL